MSIFQNRARAFENRFAHDQELEFKAQVRRNALAGHWAAETLGFTGPVQDDYVNAVVEVGFTTPHERAVFIKLRTDLETAAAAVTDDDVRAKLDALLVVARRQVRA